jgi:Lrp/AsnC family leucine-responsive transcriptional regulator
MSDQRVLLDPYERAIVTALQENGRATVQELASRIGLSTSPTWRRLKALEQRGVIKDYVARVDAAKLGYHDTVFAHVTLSKHGAAGINAFERTMIARPEVLDVYSMTGDADYLVRVVARSTREYEQFLKEAVFSSGAIQQIKSNFALREIKSTVAIPVLDD